MLRSPAENYDDVMSESQVRSKFTILPERFRDGAAALANVMTCSGTGCLRTCDETLSESTALEMSGRGLRHRSSFHNSKAISAQSQMIQLSIGLPESRTKIISIPAH